MARKKTATLGFDGAQFDEEGRRVIAPVDQALLVDFSMRSERSYRGKATGRQGHSGQRVSKEDAKKMNRQPGTFSPEETFRQRWTTCLKPEALDVLHAMAIELGIRRCEVVERLLLDPGCIERLRSSD
jgi:hypothetical protein